MIRFSKSLLFAGIAIAALGVPSAQAALLVNFQGVTPSGSNFNYSYDLVFSTAGGTEQLQPGDFVTIYDFNGLTSVITPPTNFTPTTLLVGQNPPGTNQPDNPSVINVIFTYNGPTLSVDTINNTVIQSIVGTQVRGFYAGQTTNVSDPGFPDKTANIGRSQTPAAVPEPATLAMVLAGLPLLAIVRLAGRRRQA